MTAIPVTVTHTGTFENTGGRFIDFAGGGKTYSASTERTDVCVGQTATFDTETLVLTADDGTELGFVSQPLVIRGSLSPRPDGLVDFTPEG